MNILTPPIDLTVKGRTAIQTDQFDLSAELNALKHEDDGVGAIVSFTGCVRGMLSNDGELDDSKEIVALHLEHYPDMSERILENLRQEAMTRWKLSGATVIHRIGRLQKGENIVLVITLSVHRKQAFEAACFLMDWLKTEAPFWKAEETLDGTLHWVEARKTDDEARKQWQ